MWTKENIPDQTGKTVIITGSNVGIGYETALALYEKGAAVTLACRDEQKAGSAANEISKTKSKGSIEVLKLDLSDLNQIKEAADVFKKRHDKLDLLINNAGVMVPPASFTAQGFELQFGTNVLGHYAFTGHLFNLLKAAPQSRIITVSSLVYTAGKIDYENLKSEKNYDPNREYAQSKLANLLFTLELQDRIEKAGENIISAASHPGATLTNLARFITQEQFDSMIETYGELMPAWKGALPSLFAAVSPEISGGELIGPDQDGGLRGYPTKAVIELSGSYHLEAEKLWKYAQEATGIIYP
ncbi:oxidoreductase [Flavobacterium notoginsengisoli]|uniref:oxidoreductase n=1 Tax=Flavobacterium notoginsengisoli TaxID=1478199 RepID=UPI003645913E